MTGPGDLVGRLRQDGRQLRQMKDAVAFAGGETYVRVASPDVLIDDLEEAAIELKEYAAAVDRLTKDLARTERNRDMWKGQSERQAARLTELHAAESKSLTIEAETREACAVIADVTRRADNGKNAAFNIACRQIATAIRAAGKDTA